MRRVFRILFNVATATSLVVGMAMVVMWVRSYQVRDLLDWASPRPAPPLTGEWHTHITSGSGSVVIGHNWLAQGRTVTSAFRWDTTPPHPPISPAANQSLWQRIGLGYQRWGAHWTPGAPTRAGNGGIYIFDAWDLFVPYWFLVLISAIAPLVWLMRLRSSGRRNNASPRAARF